MMFANIKLGFIVAFAVAAFGFIGFLFYKDNQMKDLVITSIVQKGVITQQSETIAIDKVVEKLNNDIGLKVVEETRKVEKAHKKVVDNTKVEIAKIESYFISQPDTAVNVQRKHNEVSTALISGLWSQYCLDNKDSADCK